MARHVSAMEVGAVEAPTISEEARDANDRIVGRDVAFWHTERRSRVAVPTSVVGGISDIVCIARNVVHDPF
jgi:sporulation protein YlmC with PRC-barrel domain